MSNKINLGRPLLPLSAIAVFGAAWSAPVMGQSVNPLEEVVVTARKREESLQDVPISINAVGAAKLEAAGIKRLEDLQALIPNFQMTETGISTQMYVRGIGTSNNQGFEQSVGQYVDGVYYGRQQLIRAPMFDLQRVEVLRGPQSILFGKNSIAGALNMTTAKPTFEPSGKFGVTLNPDWGGTEVKAIYSRGFGDNFAARVALRYNEDDGYVLNTLTNNDEVSHNDKTARATFLWTPTDNSEWTFKAEWNEFNQTGRQIETTQDDPSLTNGLTYAQLLSIFGHPQGISDIEVDYERQADAFEKSDNELQNYTLTGVFDFDSGHTLTSVTGYVEYSFDEICDCDFVGAPVFDLPMSEGYEQISQEIRISSPGGDLIDWQAGLFWQNNDVVFEDMLRVPTNSVLPSASAALGAIVNQGAARAYESDSELYAIFAEGTFHVSDEFRVTLGGRFTKEAKFGSRVANVYDLDPVTNERIGITTSPVSPLLFDRLFGFNNEQLNGHNLRGARTETSFTPSLNFQLDVNDDWMVYATAGTGFKSGGYDARGNNIQSFEFDQEEALAFELGAKGKWLDGRVETNIALYNTLYSDLQVSQFDGTIGFNVGNAGELKARGIEVDGRWAITDEWGLNYSAAYLDSEFIDFQNGNCYNRQIPDGVVVAGIPLCDYTGLSPQYTPKVTSALSLDYNRPLTGNYDLHATVDMSYASSQNVHVNLDPEYVIDAYAKFNLRVALEGDNWTFAFSGQNLTDERVLTYTGNHPLAGSVFGTNTFYSFIAPPRAFTLSASYDF